MFGDTGFPLPGAICFSSRWDFCHLILFCILSIPPLLPILVVQCGLQLWTSRGWVWYLTGWLWGFGAGRLSFQCPSSCVTISKLLNFCGHWHPHWQMGIISAAAQGCSTDSMQSCVLYIDHSRCFMSFSFPGKRKEALSCPRVSLSCNPVWTWDLRSGHKLTPSSHLPSEGTLLSFGWPGRACWLQLWLRGFRH